LTSIRGKVDDVTKNMFAIDSVVAKNDSGVVLRTNELMWRNKDQRSLRINLSELLHQKKLLKVWI